MNDLDHRPYLADTDLRTAEDVARWLREHAEQWRRDAVADPSVGARSVRLDYAGLCALQGAHADLRARLDRERRQACRRATFVNLPELARLQRKRKFAVERLWDYAVEDIDSLRRAHVDRALAFRAAARAR